jgi:hypothetical protein
VCFGGAAKCFLKKFLKSIDAVKNVCIMRPSLELLATAKRRKTKQNQRVVLLQAVEVFLKEVFKKH